MSEEKTNQAQEEGQMMTRKEVLKKAGKYAAFTASAMIAILVPKESQATSVSPDSMPEW